MITCNDLRSHIVALPPLRCHLPLLDAWHSSLRKQGVRRESASGYLMSELTEEGEQGRVLFWKGGTCATCMRHQTVKIFSGVVAMQVAQVPPFQKKHVLACLLWLVLASGILMQMFTAPFA